MNAINKPFILIITLLVLTLSVQSCGFDPNAIKGDGIIETVESATDPFTGLNVSGMFKVKLVEGTAPGVMITTDENIHEYVTVEVRNGNLHLGLKRGNTYNPTKLEAIVTVAELNKITISGAVSITGDHTLYARDLELTLSGAGNMDLKVDAENLSTSVSGAGSIEISGKALRHELSISGVASVECMDLKTHRTAVSISGAGSAKVYADEALNASVSGVGSIRYGGNPTDIQTRTSGAGSIKPI